MNSYKNIFAIIKCGCSKPKLKAIFIEENNTNAKLWLQGYLQGEVNLKPTEYVLYKLGEIDEDLKIKGFKIFICTGAQVIKTKKEVKYEQIKIFREKQEDLQKAETLKKLYKEKADFSEILQNAFGGKVI